MAILTFTKELNVSIQPGDMIYTARVVNNQSGKNHPNPGGADTTPKKYGIVKRNYMKGYTNTTIERASDIEMPLVYIDLYYPVYIVFSL